LFLKEIIQLDFHMNHTTNRILFEKPDLSRLKNNYTVVDLHFHSHYSDGTNSIPDIAQRAYDLGIGIAITDHNEIEGALELDRYSSVFSIPGIEVSSREGTHLLLYFEDIDVLKTFYHKNVRPFMGHDVMSSISIPLLDIIQRARKYPCVIIFPHPYCAAYTGICNLHFSADQQARLMEAADGVEAINSENLHKWNLKSALLGFNLNKAVTGGSDGHSIEHMGNVVSYAPCLPSRKAFLDCIRHRHNKVIGKEIDMFKKVRSNGLKLKTNLRNYPDLIDKNIKYTRIVIHSKSKLIKDNFRRSLNEKMNRYFF